MSGWDTNTAEWYARNYGNYPTNKLAVEALDLATNATVLDVGCGTGSALRHAAAQVTNGVLIGVDPVPRMLEIAREQTASHPAQISFRLGAAEELPVDDATVDVVLAFDSFDHWKDKFLGLSEIRRVLQPQGKFVVVKDGGLPGGSKQKQVFLEYLERASFEVNNERKIREGDVFFTLWECAISH